LAGGDPILVSCLIAASTIGVGVVLLWTRPRTSTAREKAPDAPPWRMRPRPSVVWENALWVIIPMLVGACGIGMLGEALAGQMSAALIVLMFLGGLVLIGIALTCVTLEVLYVARPHDPSLDQ
jgi:hypothetical protein